MGTSVKSHQRLSNLNLPAKTSFHAVIAFATAAQYSIKRYLSVLADIEGITKTIGLERRRSSYLYSSVHSHGT